MEVEAATGATGCCVEVDAVVAAVVDAAVVCCCWEKLEYADWGYG